MTFFKKSSFSLFANIFKNNQLYILISLYEFYFYVNMLGQTQYSLNSPIFTVISRLVSTSGFHFRFYREIVNVI